MPINYNEYPANWKTEIRPDIMKRAGEVMEGGKIVVEARCEWCNVPNHFTVTRTGEKPAKQIWVNAKPKAVHWEDYTIVPPDQEGTKIILTIAHLDRDKTNNEYSNLAALCQRCHLSHDRHAQHVPNRKYGRDHSGDSQLKLF